VSSIPGSNSIFEGRKIKSREDKHTEKSHRDNDTDRRVTTKRNRRKIKDQIKEDPSSRSKEEPGLLRDTTSQGHNSLQTEIVVTTSEVVVNKCNKLNGVFSNLASCRFVFRSDR
jgi:hypothetical protein